METLRIDPQTSAPKSKVYSAVREPIAGSQGGASAPADLSNPAERVQPSAQTEKSALNVRQEAASTPTLAPPLSGEQVEQEVAEINALLEKMGRREIRLSLDEESHDVIIQVVDSDSAEVVRQIPAEHVLELRERLAEMKGILINEEG